MVPVLSQALCGFWVELDCSRLWCRGIIIDQVPQAWPQLLPGPLFHHHYAWGPVSATGDTSRIWLWKWELEEGAGPRSCPPAPRSEWGVASRLLQAAPIFEASQVALVVNNPPTMQKLQEPWVPSLGQEDPLKEEMASHSSILA